MRLPISEYYVHHRYPAITHCGQLFAFIMSQLPGELQSWRQMVQLCHTRSHALQPDSSRVLNGPDWDTDLSTRTADSPTANITNITRTARPSLRDPLLSHARARGAGSSSQTPPLPATGYRREI